MNAAEAVALLRRAHEELARQAGLRAEREVRGRPTVAVYTDAGGNVAGAAVGPGDRLGARLILVDFRAELSAGRPGAPPGDEAVAFAMADGTTRRAWISEIQPAHGPFDPGEVLAAREGPAPAEAAQEPLTSR
jgi:hypothetical protein